MQRRAFIKAAGAGLASLGLPALSSAQTGAAQPQTLVQIINFHCGRCYAVNDQHNRLEQAALRAQHDFRVAPVAWGDQSLWPNQVYYSLRDLYPGSEHAARDAIFEGVHREGQRFENLDQVLVFLDRYTIFDKAKELHPNFDRNRLLRHVESDAPIAAEVRAIRLLEQSAAEEVPVFIWVRDGRFQHAISPAQASEPGALVQRVLGQLSSTR